MIVYRIAIEKYANALFASGRPARWNDKNQFVLYAGSSRSLAALELLVRRASIQGKIPYKIMNIEVKAKSDKVKKISAKDLGKNWRTTGAYAKLREIGSLWYQTREQLVLQVPSAVIPQEYNFVINTMHKDFEKLVSLQSSEDFLWDERLISTK